MDLSPEFTISFSLRINVAESGSGVECSVFNPLRVNVADDTVRGSISIKVE